MAVLKSAADPSMLADPQWEHGNGWKDVWPMGEAVSELLSWFGKWGGEGIPDIPKKAMKNSLRPRRDAAKRQIEVVAIKPHVLCGLHKGIARFNSVAQ